MPRGIIHGSDYTSLPYSEQNKLDSAFRFTLKYGARKTPCKEFIAWAKQVVQYDKLVYTHDEWTKSNSSWFIYGVTAGKYNYHSKLLLFRLYEDQTLTHELHLNQNMALVKDESLKNYIHKITKSKVECSILQDIVGEGTDMVTVDINEWKDPDANVVTITSGRTQVNLSLAEARQLLTEIPQALGKYRAARRDAIADSIKSLQEQLALLDGDSAPTQTIAAL